jgi:hypothetical protein
MPVSEMHSPDFLMSTARLSPMLPTVMRYFCLPLSDLESLASAAAAEEEEAEEEEEEEEEEAAADSGSTTANTAVEPCERSSFL